MLAMSADALLCVRRKPPRRSSTPQRAIFARTPPKNFRPLDKRLSRLRRKAAGQRPVLFRRYCLGTAGAGVVPASSNSATFFFHSADFSFSPVAS